MRVAYVMSRFPHLPETFILREMVALEAQGHQLSLYPLLVQQQPVIHPEARPWLARAFSLSAAQLVAANVRALARNPRSLPALWLEMVRELRRSPGNLLRALYIFPRAVAAAQAMRAEGIEHIHAHYATHPALFAWLVSRMTGIRYSVTVHAHDIFVDQTMLGRKLGDAAFVVAISQYNRDFLARRLGPWILDRTHLVHCGVLPERYASTPATHPAASRRLELLSIGSLQPYKGQRYLLQALARLRDLGVPFHCRIAGEGEERPQLEALRAALGLDGRVELAGACTEEQVAALLARANCYVQPSVVAPSGKMEGIPVALMEALAAGLPVIASDLSGIPELVQPGRTGYLVPPADSAALADCLAHVHRRPEEAAALAAAGRELVVNCFNIRTNARRLAGLFSAGPIGHVTRFSKPAT